MVIREVGAAGAGAAVAAVEPKSKLWCCWSVKWSYIGLAKYLWSCIECQGTAEEVVVVLHCCANPTGLLHLLWCFTESKRKGAGRTKELRKQFCCCTGLAKTQLGCAFAEKEG